MLSKQFMKKKLECTIQDIENPSNLISEVNSADIG